MLDHVTPGPEGCEETTYSFDYKNSHIVVINQYYDGKSDTGTDGDISDALFKWIKNDLESNTQPFIFVFGHEPFVSLPDHDNGRHRHKGDNLDQYPKIVHCYRDGLNGNEVWHYKIKGFGHSVPRKKETGINAVEEIWKFFSKF